MDRITRKEMKTDKFVEEVGHTVDFLQEHRPQLIRYGGIGLAAVLVVAAVWFYSSRQRTARQEALREATRIYEAAVGQSGNEYMLSFPTKFEKDKAVEKAFGDLESQYRGSDEAVIARYYLSVLAADQGRLPEAEKGLRQVAASGHSAYASLAKLALTYIFQTQGKNAEAEQLLRELMEKPTILVSREQATIALARLIASSKPAEARKLLEPLRTERSAVSRAALSALAELPQQ